MKLFFLLLFLGICCPFWAVAHTSPVLPQAAEWPTHQDKRPNWKERILRRVVERKLKKMLPPAAVVTDTCDIILLKNGQELLGKVTKQTSGTIFYKPCGDEVRRLRRIPAAQVAEIHRQAATKIGNGENRQVMAKAKAYGMDISPEKAADQSITLGLLAILSLLISLTASPLFIVLGAILGIVGFTKGIKGLKSEHQKSRNRATGGILLNLGFVLLGLLILLVYLNQYLGG